MLLVLISFQTALIRGCSQYLEVLCDLLYDDLRPRILHEPRLTVLCEVCTVLQALMVLDASTDNENGDDDDDEDSTEGSSDDDDDDDDNDILAKSNSDDKFNGKLGHRLQISHLLKMVLQDAQTRLFFKAQSVIQSDIRHFTPKIEDLAYPDMLVGMCVFHISKQLSKWIYFFFDQLQIKN